MSSTADIVIIGGGTAGLVVASRLARDSTLQIVVLEAGEDQTEDPRVLTPGLWPSLVHSPSDWDFTSVPQDALNGQTIGFPQGRLLGGTSAMNGQALIANSKSNINAWARLGNSGWDWETLLPYYKKSFSLTLPSPEKRTELGLEYVDPEYAGNGPLKASFPDALDDPVANSWVETFRGLGKYMSGDPFSGSAIGGYTNAATVDPVAKTRSYVGNAYYSPVKELPNLRVVTGALAKRVLFDNSTANEEPAATGVQYIKDGTLTTVTATREVILAAGVFNTPKILELSGIGSRPLLEKHNIPLIVDNPNVGENLQDHIFAPVYFEVADFVETKDKFMRGDAAAISASMEQYTTRKFGTFTVGGNYSGALLSLADFENPETGAAERNSVLNTIPSSLPPFETELAAHIRSLLEDPTEATGAYFTFLAQSDLRAALPGNYLTIAACLVGPLSRGSSHITSSDPSEPPAIDPRYMSHEVDLEMLARHTRYIETIRSSHPLSTMLKPGGRRSPDAPSDFRAVSLDTVKNYVKAKAKSTYHPVGTCAMMPREKGGVVDARLRVWGVTGVRVVDASVMPIIPRANVQSTVYAVAERAVDFIKEDLAG
ncbi:glucose-methanol-choline oxidoreductase-like protein [Aspergillus pseudodeflectus]|uniref:Glucose-methanol-choline oxidoreductase-like protein n=1 Tax=Aspergillus pseudodeflectus TaxID=176178 RepID=A0ABR4KU58_9EURO